MRIVTNLGILRYANSFDEVQEICQRSPNLAGKILESFVKEVVDVFEREYLSPPIEEDQRRILKIIAARGFYSYVGSWD